MEVSLIAHTPNPDLIVSAAGRLCYSNKTASQVVDMMKDDDESSKMIRMLMNLGHESPIEHVSFTFAVEGVSRVLLAQLTRHRIASYSVKSQRYVDEGQFNYTVPPEIEDDKELEKIFHNAMIDDIKTYNLLADKLELKYINAGMGKSAARKKAIEDARFVLPNACHTQLIFTMNARSLLNFFELRCCERAQWEIRELATEMLRLVRKVAPVMFGNAGPNCYTDGVCSEGKMTCGKSKEIQEKFANLEE